MARCQERIGPDFTAAEQTSETVYTLLKSDMIGTFLTFVTSGRRAAAFTEPVIDAPRSFANR